MRKKFGMGEILPKFAGEILKSNLKPNKRMTRLSLLLLLLLCVVSIKAQRRLVVIDVETQEPVTNANVMTKEGVLHTDSAGWVCLPDSTRTLLLSHVNYEERLVNMCELKDTIFLISKLLNLKEVVVFGTAKKKIDYRELNKRMQMDKTELQLAGANPNQGFGISLSELAKLLPKKWRQVSKKERRKQKLKQILENY